MIDERMWWNCLDLLSPGCPSTVYMNGLNCVPCRKLWKRPHFNAQIKPAFKSFQTEMVSCCSESWLVSWQLKACLNNAICVCFSVAQDRKQMVFILVGYLTNDVLHNASSKTTWHCILCIICDSKTTPMVLYFWTHVCTKGRRCTSMPVNL